MEYHRPSDRWQRRVIAPSRDASGNCETPKRQSFLVPNPTILYSSLWYHVSPCKTLVSLIHFDVSQRASSTPLHTVQHMYAVMCNLDSAAAILCHMIQKTYFYLSKLVCPVAHHCLPEKRHSRGSDPVFHSRNSTENWCSQID